jgi:hypothetical protein
MSNFISDLKKDKQYRETLVDSLCKGVIETSNFRDLLEYVINEKNDLFDDVDFSEPLYEDDEITEFLILPSIRRVWGKVFQDYPEIFLPPEGDEITQPWLPLLKAKVQKKLELFQLSFNIDDFLDYLVDMFHKTKNSLNSFEYLDRTSETLSLIVDNYVAMLIKKVHDCNDFEAEVRDLKLKKLVK